MADAWWDLGLVSLSSAGLALWSFGTAAAPSRAGLRMGLAVARTGSGHGAAGTGAVGRSGPMLADATREAERLCHCVTRRVTMAG